MDLLCIEIESEPRAYSDPVFLDDDRVLRNLLRTEDRYTLSSSYFKCFQAELKPYMRKMVSHWMVEVRSCGDYLSSVLHAEHSNQIKSRKLYYHMFNLGSRHVGMRRRKVSGRGVPSCNEYHGPIFINCENSKKPVAIAGRSVFVPCLETSPIKTVTGRETCALYRLFDNM